MLQDLSRDEQSPAFSNLKLDFVQSCPMHMMGHLCNGFPVYHFGVHGSLQMKEAEFETEGEMKLGGKMKEEKAKIKEEREERDCLRKLVAIYQTGRGRT